MESLRNFSESCENILDNLKVKEYMIEDSEIQYVINCLYELVDINEDYIDEAIFAIEKLCDNNEAFKKEWFGALDEVESEVLEESKLGKLASIAVIALAMGISLTGCDDSAVIEQKAQEYMNKQNVEATYKTDDTEETPVAVESDVEEEKMNIEDVKFYLASGSKYGGRVVSVGGESTTLVEIPITEEEYNDMMKVQWGYGIMVPRVVYDKFHENTSMNVLVSKDGGQTKEYIEESPWYLSNFNIPKPSWHEDFPKYSYVTEDDIRRAETSATRFYKE